MSLYTEYSHTRDSLVMENLIPEVAIRPSNTNLLVQSRLILFQSSLSFYSMFSFDLSGIRLDQTQLVGGFDFPNGTFVFNPWVNEATGIIEIVLALRISIFHLRMLMKVLEMILRMPAKRIMRKHQS